MSVKYWVMSMQERFANTGDHCCPMGNSLKPVTNLNKAVYIIEAYQKALLRIADKEGMKPLDLYGEKFALGVEYGRDDCAAIANTVLDVIDRNLCLSCLSEVESCRCA